RAAPRLSAAVLRPRPSPGLFPLHDALPISPVREAESGRLPVRTELAHDPGKAGELSRRIPWIRFPPRRALRRARRRTSAGGRRRSEEHTSELQSRENLVCRLLLEKTKSL